MFDPWTYHCKEILWNNFRKLTCSGGWTHIYHAVASRASKDQTRGYSLGLSFRGESRPPPRGRSLWAAHTHICHCTGKPSPANLGLWSVDFHGRQQTGWCRTRWQCLEKYQSVWVYNAIGCIPVNPGKCIKCELVSNLGKPLFWSKWNSHE